MKVLKFGGTSVGCAGGLGIVKNLTTKQPSDTIVVVAAINTTTDDLITAARKAAGRDSSYRPVFEEVRETHYGLIDAIFGNESERASVKSLIAPLFEELNDLYNGLFLIGDLSEKTLDTIVSYGERMSSLIVSRYLPGARWIDARQFIKTRRKQAQHLVDNAATDRLIKEAFHGLHGLTVVPGFIASDAMSGETTNLGRGGSDYTAALLAASLDATTLEIWTDVDGFMTADPAVVGAAYTIPRLSYVEAMEMCNFGAKVIYPPTIYPVCQKDIPIHVRNTFNPQGCGTLITKEAGQGDKLIKGISSIPDTALITVSGLGMVGVIGVNHRIFKALAGAGISVFLVAQASSENSTSIGMKSVDAAAACQALNEEFDKEIEAGVINKVSAECGLATVAVVGENMKHTPGIAGKLFGTLGRGGINAMAFAQGASERNISFVIDAGQLRKALNVIHDSFFLSEYKVLNLFICGTGTVGHSLIEQIREQRRTLMDKNSLRLNVVGIANSRRLLADKDGVDLDNYQDRLMADGIASSPQVLRDTIIGMNTYNSVFVDCTASGEIAGIYHDLLGNNISIVTANKIAASGDYANYASLKATAMHRGVKFLFETNVGAGLPIINTINDLINSGDKIIRIEAVLSGTLNYVFNALAPDVPLSVAVARAVEEGYAEPDPRIDLSGRDVARKLVILAREAGYRIGQGDIEQHPFIPDALMSLDLATFKARLPELDAAFERQRQQMQADGKRWRFIARLDNGHASIGLEAVPQASPFYDLAGSNNVVLLTTERYREYPMRIQGYGAGASVTAAGVFADIIRIANI